MLCWQGFHSKKKQKHEIQENLSPQGGIINKVLIPEQIKDREPCSKLSDLLAAP